MLPVRSKKKVHYQGDWGMTFCGKEGWRELWGHWDDPKALFSTLNWDEVTCNHCLHVREVIRKKIFVNKL